MSDEGGDFVVIYEVPGGLHVAEVTVDDIADASPFFGAFVYN